MSIKHDEVPRGYYVIFRPWITDPKTGKRRYPKNAKAFKLIVPEVRAN